MISIIPKRKGFFDNYDRVFGKKPEKVYSEDIPTEQVQPQPEFVNNSQTDEPNKELSHKCKCKCDGKYITEKEFNEFKKRLFSILVLERGMVLNVIRLMNQLAIADEQNNSTTKDVETLKVEIEEHQQRILNQFEDFDKFDEMVREQLGIQDAFDGNNKDTVH